MAIRRKRVQYHLNDVSIVTELADSDINLILRAADDIIFIAGRSMLAKILKGSKDKTLLEKELHHCPSYGCFNDKTLKEIERFVDWVILHGYLGIEYNGRLPMIVFTPKGWQLYKPVYADELYQYIETAAMDKLEPVVARLKLVNREVIVLLLQKIAREQDRAFIPVLTYWQRTENKKVRALIAQTLAKINKG